MTEIIPFRAVRPANDKAHLVASRSYVSYKPADLKRKLEENPFSFIHIIIPEFNSNKKSALNSDRLFNLVKKKYQEFLNSNVLIQDDTNALYIYQQITPEASYSGLICGVSVKEYSTGKIKIHEQTLTAREEVFCKYLDICDFNAEPVLLTYTENKADLKLTLSVKMTERPEVDFTTTDRIRHRLWLIDSADLIKEIQNSFAQINALYIADGHHRMASSAKLHEKRSKAVSEKIPLHGFALAYIISLEDLRILPFHRLVKSDKLLDDKKILELLDLNFKIIRAENSVIPDAKRHWGLKLASGWYDLRLKEPYIAHKQVDHLDAVILTKKVLEPIFGILDQKTDKRISFIPGNEHLDRYEKMVEGGNAAALFTLYPVSHEELIAVADANEIMPPKSTWIAPKLRSGLTIMPLS